MARPLQTVLPGDRKLQARETQKQGLCILLPFSESQNELTLVSCVQFQSRKQPGGLVLETAVLISQKETFKHQELRHPFWWPGRKGDSLVSLSEEDLGSGQREHRMFNQQVRLKEVYVASFGGKGRFPKYILILGTKNARLMFT